MIVLGWLISSIGFVAFASLDANVPASSSADVVRGVYAAGASQNLSCFEVGPMTEAALTRDVLARIDAAGHRRAERRTVLVGVDYILGVALPESSDLARARREEWAANDVAGSIETLHGTNHLVIDVLADEAEARTRADALGARFDEVVLRRADRSAEAVSVVRVWNASATFLRGVSGAPVRPCPPVAASRWFL